MTKPILELHLPPDLYERVRELADRRNVSMESYVIAAMQSLLDADRSLTVQHEIMAALSSEQLWEIARRSLPEADEARRRVLMDANRAGRLPAEESAELDALIERLDALMLLRSQALELLQERGQDILSYLKLTE